MAEQKRQHDDRADRHQDCRNAAQGERQRNQVELDEAALFLFVIDDVERVEDRLHPRVGAPQRQTKSEHESKAELGAAVLDDAIDLLLKDVEGA
jgi:hypothetical protein